MGRSEEYLIKMFPEGNVVWHSEATLAEARREHDFFQNVCDHGHMAALYKLPEFYCTKYWRCG